MKTRNIKNIKMLLVQIRKDKAMLENEYSCFLASSGLSRSQLFAHNLVNEALDETILKNFDCMAIGGSGDFSVLDNVPNTESVIRVVRGSFKNNFPVLGACFGGQLLAQIFGGKVSRDKDKAELGTVKVYKTSQGKADPLLNLLPNPFFAQAGHNDSVSLLPENAVLLAKGEACPVQAFLIKDTRIYGFQFHPELDKKNFLVRLNHHRAGYARDTLKYDAVVKGIKETKESSKLAGVFINKIVLQ